jgi:hypothetical protein
MHGDYDNEVGTKDLGGPGPRTTKVPKTRVELEAYNVLHMQVNTNNDKIEK